MFTEILSDTSGQAALSRFATANTWPAAQTFTLSATFSAGLTSTGLAQFTSSSNTVGGVVSRANGTISANPAGYANCAFQSVGAQAASATNMFDACAGVSNIILRRRNGTYSAQTTTANNDTIGQIDAQGFDSVTFRTNAQIQMFAVETFTSTANGTAMTFATTPAGTTTLTTRLTLNTTANFTVPVITTEGQINGAAGTLRSLLYRTAGSNRWAIQSNTTAEGGSNAGSDFEIRRYSDAGADLGLQLSINRATGNVTTNAGGGYFYSLGSLYGQNTIGCIGNSGTTRSIRFVDGSLNSRWQLNANATAESSTATGADFEFRRYDNSGADLGLVMAVTRSNGNITFNGGGGITSFAANKIQITTAQTPATSAAAGNAGDIAWDDTYLYVRMSTGWRRIALGAAF